MTGWTDPELIARMTAWYEAGETVVQIGDRLGGSPKMVNKILKRSGCRMRRRGPKDGPEHTGWRGGKTLDKSGYVLVWNPDHPQANHAGYVREHRLVAEGILGRFLTRDEVVHHKNGDPADNRPENLQVFDSNADHLRHELTGKVPEWTAEGYARICSPRRKATSNPESSGSDGRESPETNGHSLE